MRTLPGALTLAAALILSGCGSESPTGQVAATVNGEDVTDAEVSAEIASRSTQIDRATALQDVISRKLVSQYGHANEIDKDPTLLLDQRRIGENMLAERTLQTIAAKVPPPSDSQAEDYLTQHSEIFAGRRQLVIDHLAVPEAQVGKVRLPAGATLNQIAETLNAQHIGFGRRQVTVDTLTVNPVTGHALADKPVGSITALTAEGMRGYFQILSEQPVPLSKPDAMKVALIRLTSEANDTAIDRFEGQLRKQAKIVLR